MFPKIGLNFFFFERECTMKEVAVAANILSAALFHRKWAWLLTFSVKSTKFSFQLWIQSGVVCCFSTADSRKLSPHSLSNCKIKVFFSLSLFFFFFFFFFLQAGNWQAAATSATLPPTIPSIKLMNWPCGQCPWGLSLSLFFKNGWISTLFVSNLRK